MEVCTTLGMLSPEQAVRLKEAGLTAYNHNLDTSREFYPKVRSYIILPLCPYKNTHAVWGCIGYYDTKV